MAQATAASGDVGTGGTNLRVKVQRFGSFLSGMVMPDIGASVDALVAILAREEE